MSKMDEGLKDYAKIVVETNEANPVVVAEITSSSVMPASEYRVRLTPVHD